MSFMETDLSTDEFLKRNGIIQERARRAGRSLDRIERSIIMAARDRATEEGASRHTIDSNEMNGERDFNQVLAKTKVVAVFSHYEDGGSPRIAKELELDPAASWIVRSSNHPGLVIGGHVCAEQLINAGLKIPKAPTYEKWHTNGRKAVRR